MVNIEGAWLWEGKDKDKNLIYVITQIKDKFVWEMINKKGEKQAGIGAIDKNEKDLSAMWNYDGGDKPKNYTEKGRITKTDKKNKAREIVWDRGDVFVRSSIPE